MIQVGDRCCKNLLCAKSSQFSHVYVSPCPFQINDNNSIPTGKCSRGRSYLQNLNLLKLMVFSWIQKYQSRAKVWFFFFFWPLLLPWGQSEDLFWVCLQQPPSLYNLFPLKENHTSHWAEGSKGSLLSLWSCHPYEQAHTLCLATTSICPTAPGLMRRSLKTPHTYSVMTIHHGALHEQKNIQQEMHQDCDDDYF